jgi:hypothetical protein
MGSSSSLFKLIHSLTKSEKRYVTLMFKVHREESDLEKIFHAIEQQPAFSDAAIKKQFKNEPFIRHYSVKKVHLYDFILKALRNFHVARSIDFSLKEELTNAAILADKAMYRESRKVLKSVTQSGLKYEDWKALLEALYREYSLVPLTTPPKHIEQDIQQIFNSQKKFIDQINNYGDYSFMAMMLTQTIHKLSRKSDQKSNDTLKSIMENPLLKSDQSAISFRAKSLYYFIWSSYLMFTQQYDEAEKYINGQIQLTNRHRYFLQSSPGNYLGAMHDLLFVYYYTRRFDKAKKFMEQLRALPHQRDMKKLDTERMHQLIFSWTFNAELAIANATRISKESEKKIYEQKEYFAEHATAMDKQRELDIRMRLGVFHFLRKEYAEALRQLNMILHKKLRHFDQANFAAAALKYLINYDQGNYEALDQQRETLLRLFRKIKTERLQEKQLFHFLIELRRNTDANGAGQRHFLKQHATRFASFSKVAPHTFFDYFDLNRWFRAKLENSDVLEFASE